MSDATRVRAWRPVAPALLCLALAGFAAGAEDLTEFGAVRNANADGSIPAYTGGLKTPPPGYKPGSGIYIDPYKDEKPLYTITAQNLGQYESQLSEGTKAMLKRWPDYKINVYPTHRSMPYPDWVLANSAKNAKQAKLGGKVKGDSVENAYPGIPFPQPKDGYEAMWNSFLHYDRDSVTTGGSWMVDTRGKAILLNTGSSNRTTPFYEGKTDEVFKGSHYMANTIALTSPANLAGYVQMQRHPIDYGQGQENWVFDPGQRRVRVAPNFTYDTPVAQYGGVLFYDEGFGFLGRLDRFDFKLVGRKELLIPYNVYTFHLTPPSKLLGPKFFNPEFLRWEKHRVWEVEAVRKPGARHAYAKRKFYIDEDSWTIFLTEGYDDSGKVSRVGQIMATIDYTGKGGISNSAMAFYDLVKGNYASTYLGQNDNTPVKFQYSNKPINPNLFTPQGISNSGNR